MSHATDDRIIAAALEAAMDPDRWTDLLDLMATHVPGGRVYLMRYWNDGGGMIDGQSRNYDEAFTASYFAHYHLINPRVPALHGVPMGVATANHVNMPYDVLRRSEFYNDWMRPQEDCYRGGGLLVSCQPTVAVYLGSDMPAGHAEPAEDAWVSMLGRVAPFLAHAARVNDALFSHRLDRIAAHLAPHGPAWFLVGPGARVVMANPEGEAMIAEGGLVRLDGLNRLRLCHALPTLPPLAEMIAARRCLQFRVGPLQPARAQPGADSISAAEVLVTPVPHGVLHPQGRHHGLWPDNLLSLVVVALRRNQPDPEVALAGRLGLSLAEAAVAQLLADGRSIAEIAVTRDRAEVTVRNQIKAACQKLGVRGQAGLVRATLTARAEIDRTP